VVGCWRGCLSGARCRLACGPADATATHFLVPADPASPGKRAVERVPVCSQESCCAVQKSHNLTYAEEDVMFFEHQLDLFGKLAYVSHVYVHLCIDVKNVEIKYKT